MTSRPERHLVSHVFNVVVIAIGLAAVGWMLHSVGRDGVRQLLGSVGWWFAVVVGLDLAVACVDGAAIHAFMRPEARMVGYWRVVAAQISGVAINLVTPGGKLGEATKITMLIGHAPRARAASSVVLFHLVNLYLSIAILIVGVPLTVVLADIPHHLEIVAIGTTAVLGVIGIGLAVLVRRGALASVLAAAVGIRLIGRDRAARWTAKIEDVDHHLRELAVGPSPGMRRGIALLCASRVISWTALVVALHAVGVPLTAAVVVGMMAFGIAVGWLASTVPFGLGVSDGGHYALLSVLAGAPVAGIGLAMVNRGRSLALAVVGLIVMAVMHTANRLSLGRRNARMATLADRFGWHTHC